jgi:hypothetical protein
VTWIELVGGPEDGHRVETPDDEHPPMCYFRPREDQGLRFSFLPQAGITPAIAHDTYQMMLDEHGHPSRNDDGVLRYQYRRS